MSSLNGVGSISSAGLGSGLNVESIVSKLVAIEKQPIDLLTQHNNKLQTQLSSWGKVKSDLAALRDAAQSLTVPSTWNANTAGSSDEDAVSVASTNSASQGTYNISVQNLASAQSLTTTTPLASSSKLGSGKLTIELGRTEQVVDDSGNPGILFTPKAGTSPFDITIAATDTLADIRDKINSANSSVKAAIITDDQGARLTLMGTPGSNNGFRLKVDDNDGKNDDNAGLSSLAYDPAAYIQSMQQTQAATNATVKINGLAISSESNKITAIEGLTLSVHKTTSSVDINVAQDKTALKKSIENFVTAYNNVSTRLRDLTKYDAGSKTAGTLQGDGSAIAIGSQLNSLVSGTSEASNTFKRLSDLGIQVQANGTLTINANKLDTALNNPEEIKKAFTNSTTTNPSSEGFAQKFRTYADRILSSEGTLANRTTGLQKNIDLNAKRQDSLSDRAAAYEARIRAQYTALDTTLARLNATSSYVTRMINSGSNNT